MFKEILEILGTASFAISGALAALNKRLDVFGVLIITFATAVGGGTIRDVMIGNTPVAWMQDQTAIRTIFISYVLTLLFQRHFKKLPLTLTIFDAIGLGFATIVGLQRGLEAQLSPSICITLGMVTGCFGGVVRDVLLNEIPLVFRKDIYASASLLGGLLYFLLSSWEMVAPLATSLSILSVVLLRLVVVRYGWTLPNLGKRDGD
jgi:uncharacterized membrane protein YeiH